MLPIMALIFSILMPFVGLILAIIDMARCKSQGKKQSSLTTAALVLSGVRIGLSILIMIFTLYGSMLR